MPLLPTDPDLVTAVDTLLHLAGTPRTVTDLHRCSHLPIHRFNQALDALEDDHHLTWTLHTLTIHWPGITP